MPPAKRRERLSTEERREQLLALGTDLFSSRSFDAISIDEIATAAGISKGLLYHYFPTKRDFYVAVVERAVENLHTATAPDPGLDPAAVLVASLDAYLDYVVTFAEGWSALLRAGIGADSVVNALVETSRTRFVERTIANLPIDSERAADPLVRIAVRGWVGFVEAATLDWLERDDVDRRALRDLLAGALPGALAAAGVTLA